MSLGMVAGIFAAADLLAAGQAAAAPPTISPLAANHFPGSYAVLAQVAAPADANRQFDEPESHSQHAARVNRNLLVATVSILSLFVLCRIGLLWQISRTRKKQARENLLETKA